MLLSAILEERLLSRLLISGLRKKGKILKDLNREELMLMNRLSIWCSNTPFRKWLLERDARKYYSEYFNELKGKTVLEIGCGSGFGAEIVLKYFSPQKIIATDLDPRMVVIAKKNIKSKKIIVEQADATRLGYKNKSFDAVFGYGMIHHIPAPEWKDCLNEIYRVLKPGGMLFLRDLSAESFKTLRGRVIKLFTIHPYNKMYRKEEFVNYLVSIGFKTLKRAQEPRFFTIVAKK